MGRSTSGAVASDLRVAELCSRVLLKGGSAADACVAAFLGAAAAFDGVLLGPATIISAGPGVGAHVYDGSALQPGQGAQRPRGYREGDYVPEIAHVALSSAIAAISTAHAQDGILSMSDLASWAADIAQTDGQRERAKLIRAVGAGGPLAIRQEGLVKGILEVVGRVEGGMLTPEDFEQVPSSLASPQDDRAILSVTMPTDVPRVSLTSVVAAVCDSRGVLGAIHMAFDTAAIPVDSVQLSLSKLAVPVLRGVPWVRPGTRLPIPSPIAIVSTGASPWGAVALEGAVPCDWGAMVKQADDGLTVEQALETLLGTCPSAKSALAAIRGEGATAPVRLLRQPSPARG